MNKSILIFFCIVVGLNAEAMDKDSFFDKADVFFNKYTIDGKVKYGIIKRNTELLNELTNYITIAPISQFSREEQKAFYINAYNLLVIHSIAEHYPVDSPMKIPGFFDKTKHKVGREDITLNDLENHKLRETTHDPRIHFALVCAAKGCPKIKNGAYFPDELSHQLESQARKALNDDYFIRVQPNEQKVLISQIFEWYKSDFGDDEKDVLNFINQYRDKRIAQTFQINYYKYDWQLNDYR